MTNSEMLENLKKLQEIIEVGKGEIYKEKDSSGRVIASAGIIGKLDSKIAKIKLEIRSKEIGQEDVMGEGLPW